MLRERTKKELKQGFEKRNVLFLETTRRCIAPLCTAPHRTAPHLGQGEVALGILGRRDEAAGYVHPLARPARERLSWHFAPQLLKLLAKELYPGTCQSTKNRMNAPDDVIFIAQVATSMSTQQPLAGQHRTDEMKHWRYRTSNYCLLPDVFSMTCPRLNKRGFPMLAAAAAETAADASKIRYGRRKFPIIGLLVRAPGMVASTSRRATACLHAPVGTLSS